MGFESRHLNLYRINAWNQVGYHVRACRCRDRMARYPRGGIGCGNACTDNDVTGGVGSGTCNAT
jgi:hypothetical protein